MKNLKVILLLCNLFVFIIIYFSNNNSEELSSTNKFLIDDVSNLQEFILKLNNKNIAFKKINNDWFVVSPLKWKANEMAVSKFIAIFSHLKKEKVFSVEEILQRGELLNDYGINKNSTTYKLINSNISTQVILGKKTRDQKFFYASIKTNETVSNSIWRIPVEIDEITDMSINNWIHEELIQQNIYSVDELTVNFKLSGENYNETILKRLDDKWEFTKPFASNANKEKIRILLSNLLSEKIQDFNISNNEEFLKEKINYEWKIKLQIKANDNISTFKFSEKFLEDKIEYRYCKTDYSDHIVKINNNFIELLSDWSSKLRERKIFEYSKNEIESIDFIKSDNNFSIIKTINGSWNIIDRNKNNELEIGDNQIIENFITNLNEIEVKEFLSFDPVSVNKDYDKKGDLVFKLKILMQDTTQRTIIVSKSDKDASLWKTQIQEESLLCLVDKSWDEISNKKAYDYKSKKLLNMETKIGTIQINFADENKTLIKVNDENMQKVTSVVDELTVLKYINNKSKYEGTWNGGDWVPWTYNLQFYNQSEALLKTLSLSSAINDNYYLGNLSDNNLTFEIADPKFISVINIITDLK